MKVLFATADGARAQEWLDALQAALPDAQVDVWDPEGASVGAEIAVVWRPPQGLLQREPGLKALFNLGAGVDAIMALPGLSEGISVLRVEDAGMGAQMAEYVVHAVVRASRRLAEYETLQRAGAWRPLEHIDRSAWPIGIMGMGLMGERVAKALVELDYPVAGWSRSPKTLSGIASFAGMGELGSFLSRTRVLVNTLPLTPDTRNILRRETMSQLLPRAHVVNVARGEHLVEEDLLALLDEGHVEGAALDVFRQEPLPAGHPFWTHPRVMVTPHVAAGSLLRETVGQVAANIRRYARNEPMTGRVARDLGY